MTAGPGLLASAVIILASAAGAARAADWPQFRADAARTGYTAEELPGKLQLEWTFRPAHPPRPSWPHETRVVYDRASHAVVAGGTVYFGSSADDRVRALDAATGKELWRRTENVWGTVLSLSVRHDVLLMSGQPAFAGFGLTSDQVGKLAAYQAGTGKPLWEADAKHMHRPVVIDRTICLNNGKLDLLTGKGEGFRINRQHGCGMVVGSPGLLLFRSAVLGYIDLTKNRRTTHFGSIRPGCWVNAIPAGGMVLMPDFTTKCGCAYDNKACLALESAEVGGQKQEEAK